MKKFYWPLTKLPLEVLKTQVLQVPLLSLLGGMKSLSVPGVETGRDILLTRDRPCHVRPNGSHTGSVWRSKESTLNGSGPVQGMVFLFKHKGKQSRAVGWRDRLAFSWWQTWALAQAQTSYPWKTHFTDCWQGQPTQIKLPDLTILDPPPTPPKKYKMKILGGASSLRPQSQCQELWESRSWAPTISGQLTQSTVHILDGLY
jgi:hypothetical protein